MESVMGKSNMDSATNATNFDKLFISPVNTGATTTWVIGILLVQQLHHKYEWLLLYFVDILTDYYVSQ